MSEIDLLPCPFCGGDSAAFLQDGVHWYVECDDCNASTYLELTKPAAARWWNRRVDMDGEDTVMEFLTAGLRFVERKCRLPMSKQVGTELVLQQRWEVNESGHYHLEWRDVPTITLEELEEEKNEPKTLSPSSTSSST